MHISDKEAWIKTREHMLKRIRAAPPELFVNDNLELHIEKVHKWGYLLEPSPSYRLKIAWDIHDIDRADVDRIKRGPDEPFEDYKQRHQARSARLGRELLTCIEARPQLIEDVFQLVLYHDQGNLETADAELQRDYLALKDADGAAFLDSFDEYVLKWDLEHARIRGHKTWEERLTDRAKSLPDIKDLWETFQRKLRDAS